MPTENGSLTARITPEHKNEHLHAAELDLDGVVHASVMGVARSYPHRVIDLPGARGGLLTRQDYLASYDEFARRSPEVIHAIAARSKVRGHQRTQQGHIDDYRGRATRAMRDTK